MNVQNKEDINALKKRNVKLKFLVGLTGSGKATQAIKVQQEFGITHICTTDLVKEESQKNTTIGTTLKDHMSKGTLIPTEIIAYILLRKLVNTEGKTFLISGFPRTLDQALYIEKHLQEVNFILYFNLPENKAPQRIKEKYKNNIKDDAVEKRINEFKTNTIPMINFYRRFGVIRDINAEGNVNQVYRSVKESLLPEIYCIIGKRYSGKSTIAKALAERLGMNYICFEDFLKTPNIQKRASDDEYIIKNFLDLLREENSRRVIIEDFPRTENQYKLFIKNGKNISKVYKLNAEDYIVSERMMSLGKNHPNYVGCTKLKEELDAYQSYNVSMFLKNTPDLVKEFDVNNYFKLDYQELLNQIKPKVLLVGGPDSDIKQKLIDTFIQEKGYHLLNVSLKKLNLKLLGRKVSI